MAWRGLKRLKTGRATTTETAMKRTKEDRDYLRFKGRDIIECRQQYNKYAGDDEQRISQKNMRHDSEVERGGNRLLAHVSQ